MSKKPIDLKTQIQNPTLRKAQIERVAELAKIEAWQVHGSAANGSVKCKMSGQ